jgi:hypothetical protein
MRDVSVGQQAGVSAIAIRETMDAHQAVLKADDQLIRFKGLMFDPVTRIIQ